MRGSRAASETTMALGRSESTRRQAATVYRDRLSRDETRFIRCQVRNDGSDFFRAAMPTDRNGFGALGKARVHVGPTDP